MKVGTTSVLFTYFTVIVIKIVQIWKTVKLWVLTQYYSYILCFLLSLLASSKLISLLWFHISLLSLSPCYLFALTPCYFKAYLTPCYFKTYSLKTSNPAASPLTLQERWPLFFLPQRQQQPSDENFNFLLANLQDWPIPVIFPSLPLIREQLAKQALWGLSDRETEVHNEYLWTDWWVSCPPAAGYLCTCALKPTFPATPDTANYPFVPET